MNKMYKEKLNKLREELERKTYVIDIDGTICTQEDDANDCKPFMDVINKVNKLHDEGNEIIFYTARPEEIRDLTEKQLKDWGVKYDELIMDKIKYDVLVDDKAINIKDWDKLDEKTKEKIKGEIIEKLKKLPENLKLNLI
jgi:uncharacterized HAD superfamily protein